MYSSDGDLSEAVHEEVRNFVFGPERVRSWPFLSVLEGFMEGSGLGHFMSDMKKVP